MGNGSNLLFRQENSRWDTRASQEPIHAYLDTVEQVISS